MKHQFSLTVDPILGTGSILLDQQPVYAQSQLQICTTQNFFDWYRDLPDLMFAEVNDSYSVTVRCLDIQYQLLKSVFSASRECQSLQHIPVTLAYTVEQRFGWLGEAASRVNVRLPEVPRFSVQAPAPGFSDCSSILGSLPAFYRKYCAGNVCAVNIWLIAGADPTSVPQDRVTRNDLILRDAAPGYRAQTSQIPILCQGRSAWAETVRVWADQMIFLPYLIYCQDLLLMHNKHTSFEVTSRIRMLTREDPYAVLTLPSRIETGTACPIRVDVFPSVSYSLRIGDPNLLSLQKDQLIGRKPGRTSVSVVSQRGQVLHTKDMEVYFVTRVTSISLTSPNGSSLLLGSTFQIRAAYQPQSAVNLSQAVWSVSPANALRHLGGGQFTALAPGKCSVTLTVEKVSQSISLDIIPLATDIRLPPEVRFKVNAPPCRITAGLLPQGSACREIRCSVADGRIAQWNPNLKSVVAMSEGNTTLEAVGIGPSGNVLFRKSCPVIILPEKDIITPPTLLTLAICCAIVAVLTAHTGLSPLALIGALVLFGITAVTNGLPWIRHRGTRDNKLQTSVAIVGAVLTVLLFSVFR